MARLRWATGYARRVISRARITAPPVNVQRIAEAYGVEVIEESFPDDISGALHRGREQSVIAVNKGHHENRQRFTIAHELGHYLLHADSPAYYDHEHQVGVHFRASTAAGNWDVKEVEANRFAAELLMPRRMIIEAIQRSGAAEASTLAKLFEVSEEAMTYRLADIRIR